MSDNENEIDVVEENPGNEVEKPKEQNSGNQNKQPQSPNELLMWALEHYSGQPVDKSKLMDPEQFAKIIKTFNPDQISVLRDALEKLKEKNLTDDEIQLQLDTIVKNATAIMQANWFADLGGFPVIADYLNNHNAETRRGAAMIIALCNQNNKKVQQKYNKSPGMKLTLEKLTGETDIKAAKQKIIMISCLLSNCIENRIDFYKCDGFRYLLDYCSKWPQLWHNLAFTIVGILEEENPNDAQEMNRVGLRILSIQNRQNINDDNLLKIIIKRLL